MSEYFSTNIINESVSSLDLARENLLIVEDDVYRWKWIVIALHNALQNTMVSALKQGNGFHSMTNDSFKKWMEAYRGNKPLPPTKLANFLDLYKRIKKKHIMECYVHRKRFVAKQEHTESIKKLNSIRNGFIHFSLDVWSLEIAGMPELCLHCMDVIRFLVFESRNVVFYKEGENKIMRSAIIEVMNILRDFDATKNS